MMEALNSSVKYNSYFVVIEGNELILRLIKYDFGNEQELPFYWYEIVHKVTDKVVGKISIRIGNNYHSYYNGHIGYEVDEEYRGHNYAYKAVRTVLKVARYYGAKFIYLTCNDDNVASYKIIEKLGAQLVEKLVPPKDYFGYYEGIPLKRIYRLEL